MEVATLVRQHLQVRKMMQLATSVDNQPWCVTVLFVPDEQLNLYWVSKPDTRHSQEIMKNPKVAAAIPVKLATEGDKVGLSVEGEAQEVSDPETLKKAVGLYAKRYSIEQKWQDDFLAGNNAHKMYKLNSKMFVLFDQENFKDKPRQEWRVE